MALLAQVAHHYVAEHPVLTKHEHLHAGTAAMSAANSGVESRGAISLV